MVGPASRPPRKAWTPVGDDVVPKVHDDDENELSSTDQTALIAPKSVRSAQRATLIVLAGTATGRIISLDKDRLTFGRSRTADVILTDPGVSRMHCTFVKDASGRYSVEDLMSTNGILVNGKNVSRAELSAGDRVQIGADAVVQFAFHDEAEEGLARNLYEAATRDPLTKAFNRRHFQERLASEMSYAQRHKEPLVAVVFDIDHFKSVNDSYGHAAGDAALRDVAAAVAATLRNEDVFARIGGEEFVVLARGLNVKNGTKLAERIRVLIEGRVIRAENHKFRVTVSCGVAELKEDKDATGEGMLRLADGRLYAAKRAGRNRVVAK